MAIQTEHEVVKSELKWAAVAGVTVGVIFAAIVGAALAFQMNPPSNIEHIDPKTLHLSGNSPRPISARRWVPRAR